jgi:hypothetical protein
MDESTKALSAVQNPEEKGLINPLQLYKKDDLIILQAMGPNMQAVEGRKEKKKAKIKHAQFGRSTITSPKKKYPSNF